MSWSALQLLLFALARQVTALGHDAIGTFTSTQDPAIDSSLSNKGELADYSFYVRITTAIPAGGTLVIEFPDQFSDGLGGASTCKTYTCSCTGRQLTMTITPALAAGSSVTMVVYSVLNPNAEGGSGPFSLSSYKNKNLLDQNTVFGVVGIAHAITTLASASVNVQSGSSKKAGEVTRYEFSIKVQSTLPKNSWMRYTFPSSFTISQHPTCEAYTINGKTLQGDLSCEQTGNKVKVLGLVQEVFPNTEVGVRVSLTNPSFSGSPGMLTVETGRASTNTIYERITNIPSPVIEPGQITGVRLTPVDTSAVLATSKPVLYNLKFTTANTCSQGKVEVEFNSDFNMDSQPIYYVEYGLEDISATQPVTLAYSSKKLTITNFKAFTTQQISLVLLVTNPQASGDTQPLVISTYQSDFTTRIDQNSLDAKIAISSISAPDITPSYPGGTTDQATGASISLLFTLVPQKSIPKLGYIKVKVPAEFAVSSGSLVCKMKPKNIGLDNAAACSYSEQVLTLQLYSSTLVSPAGDGDFLAAQSSYISFTAGITAPTKAGNYYFDFTTYDASSKLLESGTALVTLTAKQVAGATFDLIHTELDTISVVALSFTPDLAVPSGASPAVTTDLQGFIEVSLPTQSGGNNLFRTDLGLGINQGEVVPCVAGAGLTGTLKCELSTKPSSASNATPAVVTVSGFGSIAVSTNIVLYLGGVKAMQTSNTATITVLTYSKLNRLRTNINSFSDATAAGASTAATSTTATALSFSSTTVSSTTNLSATLTTTVATTATRPFLLLTLKPVHDAGYCLGATVTCTVNAVTKTCHCFAGVDAVLINLNSVSLAAGGHTFTVSGLVQPESVSTTSEYLKLYTSGGSNAKNIITYSTPLPSQTPTTFSQTDIKADRTGAGSPYVTFSFSLTAALSLPNAGQVEVLFPSEYVLSNSTPGPSCSSDLLTPYTGGFGCSIFNNRATITNIAAVAAGSSINYKIVGVKHPSAVASTYTFRTMNSSGRVIAEATSVAGFALTSVWSPGTLSVSSITAFPTNAKQKVEYTVTFTPTYIVPKGAYVSITYPLVQFGNLPLVPECRVSGALSTLSSCSAEANTIKYLTDDTSASGALTFSLFNVDNFDEGSSNEFSVKIEYDSVVVEQTATGAAALKASSTAVYSPLQVSKVDFDPRNEGEVSTYQLTFLPALNIAVDTYVTVLFPAEYDHNLGETLTCWSEELLGSLSCSVIHERMLQVVGHSAFTACTTCSVNVHVYGVVNPRKTTTSNLQIGMLKDNRYTETNLSSGTFKVLEAPGYNNVLETTLENQYSRYDNSFSFNMTTTLNIPTIQYEGAIWLRFPTEYELAESTLNCTSSAVWADGAPKCEVDKDRVILNGQQTAYKGNMYVRLGGVPNPISEITARSITVSTYDGLNKQILQRTYPNLNPTSFKYTFPGPVIRVNNDVSFTVDRGTMSDFIPIALDFPCSLNLTLTPSSMSGLTFVPAVVSLGLGEVVEYFRVSVPQSKDPGTYFISWTVEGDVDPPYYTPLSKTKFTVVKTGGVKVQINEIPVTVSGGTSLPIYVILDRAPNVDLTVTINSVKNGYAITPSLLQFVAGEVSKPFHIAVSKSMNETYSNIELSLSGTNVSPYALVSSSYEFAVSLLAQRTPLVTGAFAKQTARTKVVAEVSANNVAYCYYVYALLGSSPPSFEEAKTQGPALYVSTQTVYGVSSVANNLTTDLQLKDLTAETKYSLFVWLEDTLATPSAQVYSYTFQTAARQPAAQFTLYFTQTYLNDVEVDLVRNAVCLLLSLSDWRVVEKDRQTIPGRRLAEDKSKLTLYIVDDPSSDVYPSPKELVDKLQSAKLGAMINNLDTTYSITGTEVSKTPCSFSVQPALYQNATDYNQISVLATMPANGHFYAVLMSADNDPGKPRSTQIANSLNSLNLPVQSTSLTTIAGVSFNVTFTDLTQLTEYNIYATCGNDYPVFPTLLDDAKVVSINWKTEEKPAPRPLNTNSACWVELGVLTLLSLV
jgi:histone deacetylase 6